MKAKFRHLGLEFEVQMNDTKDYKKSRAYVSGADEHLDAEKELAPLAKSLGAPHIYTHRGDFPELDKAWDAFNKKVVEAQRAVLVSALAALNRESGHDLFLRDTKLSFSKHAGCRVCPCSPGFIITGGPLYSEIFVSLVKKTEPSFLDFYAECN